MDLKSITTQANLIIASSHDFSDIAPQFRRFQADLYTFLNLSIDDISWIDLIEMPELDNGLRQILINLDDCLDLHNTTRYM